MILVDVMRAGPSTGMPTKNEQGDLLHAMFGRHGESPIPIVAPSSPADCFSVAMEAARVAIRYRTPVILLSDSFLQNSSEPWLLPDIDALPTIDPKFAEANGADFLPYARDERLARPWAIPGTPGLEHRIGGLEREDRTGDISYEAENHERMTQIRREKVEGIAADIPPLEVDDPTGDAELLVLGWGRRPARSGRVQRVRDGQRRPRLIYGGQPDADEHGRGRDEVPTIPSRSSTRDSSMLIRPGSRPMRNALEGQGPIFADELEEAM